MFYKSLLISLLTTFLTISACSAPDNSATSVPATATAATTSIPATATPTSKPIPMAMIITATPIPATATPIPPTATPTPTPTLTPTPMPITSWTTGDIDQLIANGESITFQTDSLSSSVTSLTIKYGLWNSPIVNLRVLVNGSVVGSVEADNGWYSGTKIRTWDISNYSVSGINTVVIEATTGGGAKIG